MIKKVSLLLFLCFYIGSSVLNAAELPDDQLEPLVGVEYVGVKKKPKKEERVSKRGLKWLRNVFEVAVTNEDYVNIAAVYYFANVRQGNNAMVSGMVWIGMVPVVEAAVFTFGVGMVGTIPIAGVSIGYGVQSHRYGTLKKRAKQLLVEMNNATFTKIRNADLSKLGDEKANADVVEDDDEDSIDPSNKKDIQYEGLQYLLAKRGYDVSRMIEY